MKRVFAVIELADGSTFDPADDADLDALAEDLLRVAHGVSGAVTYASLGDLLADESSG